MRLIVLSDSHGDTKTIRDIASLQADAIFHCGDSELQADDSLLAGIHIVRGNCDFDRQLPAVIVQPLEDEKVFLVHGHEHDVKRSMLNLSYAAAEQQATIALFGHSHLYGAEMIDGVLFVNPGSTTQPRGGNVATYAVIETGDGYTVGFYDMSHALIEKAVFKK